MTNKDPKRKIIREMERDLKQMESIQWRAQWLNGRDSNCGNAASLTDAIEVLIARAIEMHKEELANWHGGASKEGVENRL